MPSGTAPCPRGGRRGQPDRTCLACSLHAVTPSEVAAATESRGLAVRMSEQQRPQRDSSTLLRSLGMATLNTYRPRGPGPCAAAAARRPMNRPLGRDGPPAEARKAATSRESAQGEIRLGELPSARQGERLRREPGTGNRKRRTVSEVAIMARDGQVLPPVPAPGSNTLCRIVLLSNASPELAILAFRSVRPLRGLPEGLSPF
jgi:hypothetical protein